MPTNRRLRLNRLPLITTMVVMSVVPPVSADGDLAILTFPIGLVVGEHEFEVDLGPLRAPAALVVDGQNVCALGGDIDSCTVDLGPDPKVRLVELVRHDATGTVTERDHRWVNRPGQEAELDFRFSPRDEAGVCRGSVIWLHPGKLRPALLRIQHGGRILRIHDDGRSFAYPCTDPSVPNLLTASAIFPDGRRAEAVSLTGGFGGHEGVAMTASPLVDGNPRTTGCAGLDALLESTVQSFEDSGFEVVFVLDPSAGYRGLLSTAGRRYSVSSSWRRADASLWEAERMWIVTADPILSRLDAYDTDSVKGHNSSASRMNWLTNLFFVANVPIKGNVRLADAVAASGLVAAAGPRRRAIVLVLGNHADRDTSQFTPAQARAYLAEIGVPLRVLRIGKPRDDGWPEGDQTLTMRTFAEALEKVEGRIDQQCVAWFRGDLRLDAIAAELPEGIAIAGRP